MAKGTEKSSKRAAALEPAGKALLPDEQRDEAENEKASEKRRVANLRYWIASLATCISAMGLANSFAYNFAVVCGVERDVDTEMIWKNDTRNSPIMHFPPWIGNTIYSTYSLGGIFTMLALLLLRPNVSVRTQVMIGSAISTACCILIPLLYDYYPFSTFLLKTLQGAASAPTIPLIGHVTAHWTPVAEVGFIVAILSSYSQIGIFFTMGTSGVICTTMGWRAIFYWHGFVSFILTMAWFMLFRDFPAEHPLMSTRELCIIQYNKNVATSKNRPKVPYRAFFSSMSVWAVLVAAIGNYNGISPLIVFAPSILKKAVGLSDIATANYNTVSFAMQLTIKLLSGRISDRWLSVGESFKTRFFSTISCGLCGALMILTAFIPEEKQVLCALSITITQAIIGFNSAGFNKAAMIVTRQYAHLIMTLIGVIISASTIAEPFLVAVVAPDTTWQQWGILFLLHGGILVVSNLLFCLMITAKPAPFTMERTAKSALDKEQAERPLVEPSSLKSDAGEPSITLSE